MCHLVAGLSRLTKRRQNLSLPLLQTCEEINIKTVSSSEIRKTFQSACLAPRGNSARREARRWQGVAMTDFMLHSSVTFPGFFFFLFFLKCLVPPPYLHEDRNDRIIDRSTRGHRHRLRTEQDSQDERSSVMWKLTIFSCCPLGSLRSLSVGKVFFQDVCSLFDCRVTARSQT